MRACPISDYCLWHEGFCVEDDEISSVCSQDGKLVCYDCGQEKCDCDD